MGREGGGRKGIGEWEEGEGEQGAGARVQEKKGGSTATSGTSMELASQGDGCSTALKASQASSTTKSTTDTNCIIGPK
jgi:hypothetical protein